MDFSKITLGELLSHANETIKRNAMSILKQLQRKEHTHDWDNYGKCTECGKWNTEGE